MTNCESLNLRELNSQNFYSVCMLSVKPEQINHVDSNSISMAEANFSDHAWMRGIYLNDKPVGFVMVETRPESHYFYLWRFMIDQHHQGLGFGHSAFQLIVKELKSIFDISVLKTSVVPAEKGPQKFYEGLGFKLTGKYIEERELELALNL